MKKIFLDAFVKIGKDEFITQRDTDRVGRIGEGDLIVNVWWDESDYTHKFNIVIFDRHEPGARQSIYKAVTPDQVIKIPPLTQFYK